MGNSTKIEWTDHTFNPWIGCTKVSPACANCYAKARDDRHLLGPESHWGPGAPRRIMADSYWRQPLQWAKKARALGRRHKVFTASQADIFDMEAPQSERRRLWSTIELTGDILDWQILTKRPERISEVMNEDRLAPTFFLDNKCWLGTSVEDQDHARKRIPPLVQVLAWFHFLSCEPLLGELDLLEIRSLCTCLGPEQIDDNCLGQFQLIDGINWVIAGGESGHGARSMQPVWVRSLRDQCSAASVPFFFKQWGEWGLNWLNDENGKVPDSEWMDRVGKKAAGALLDGMEHKNFPGEAHG